MTARRKLPSKVGIVVLLGAALLLLVTDLVVVLEQVLTKVAAEVAPHGMDVVGVVLRVV